MLLLILKLLLNPRPLFPWPSLFLPIFNVFSRGVLPKGLFYGVFHSLRIKILSNRRRLAKHFGLAASYFAIIEEILMGILCKDFGAASHNIADLVKHELTPGCDAVFLL